MATLDMSPISSNASLNENAKSIQNKAEKKNVRRRMFQKKVFNVLQIIQFCAIHFMPTQSYIDNMMSPDAWYMVELWRCHGNGSFSLLDVARQRQVKPFEEFLERIKVNGRITGFKFLFVVSFFFSSQSHFWKYLLRTF